MKTGRVLRSVVEPQERSVSERIERVVTSGTFSLDGGCWDVDNNVWTIGNDSSVIIIDPPTTSTRFRAPSQDAPWRRFC